MPEFIDLLPPDIALTNFLEQIPRQVESEVIEVKSALGRVAVNDVHAPHSLPAFHRSTVDGYAVIASDTHGASDSQPVYLVQIEEIKMGESPDFTLLTTQCGLIHTGGMLPKGSDAVVMLENTQVARPGEIEILRAVAEGENVIKVGEDIAAGAVVVAGGTLLRAAEIGGLLALGITELQVARRPRVGIISSGDEIIPPESVPNPGQVRDINSYSLSALVEQAGGVPQRYGIIPDDYEKLRGGLERAIDENNMVVITAGSSASSRDLTAQVINSLGGPGVITHGVNIRPGKPTILAGCQPAGVDWIKPVIGLPGNPVSALVIGILFVEPVINFLHGQDYLRPRGRLEAKLAINLASKAGREDWVPVKILPVENGFSAEPIFGKSNLIFTLCRADGLLHIPPHSTGLNAGEIAEVMLLN
ncbi:MAG: molybdopterin molybdotransferase MoeA [Chloroflexota bacterium]|nr:MAG: molybdopterin molybdotransferase MoeA [Chloroflexota bacterium]